jgi:hypothetical protein
MYGVQLVAAGFQLRENEPAIVVNSYLTGGSRLPVVDFSCVKRDILERFAAQSVAHSSFDGAFWRSLLQRGRQQRH